MPKKEHSLYRKVYRTLRGRILSGEYELGAQIETEPELAAQFDASMITIRQAAQMLHDEGLLDKQQGRGTFVPLSVRNRLKILCVCGLDLAEGLKQRMGSYHSDLIILSQGEAARRGMEVETVWLAQKEPDRARHYGDESVIREYWGVVFIACRPDHVLLQRVRQLKLRHVTIAGRQEGADRWVWLDQREAIRLALEVFDVSPAEPPPIVMGIDNLRRDVEAVLRATRRYVEQIYVPGPEQRFSFETAGYLKTQEVLQAGTDLSRVIFLDDVVAQGATRALLQAGYARRDVRYLVICGRQELVPLGFPVTYVVHDTVEEVRHAFEILEQPYRGESGGPTTWRSGFRIARADELDPAG